MPPTTPDAAAIAEPSSARRARWALLAFVITFILARTMVLLIMSGRIPNLYLFLQGTHVHHLNYGIFLLAGDRGLPAPGRPHRPGGLRGGGGLRHRHGTDLR